MALLEIQVPDIGDFDEVTVIELMVKPGDAVAADQSLITVESDKASMEIPSSHAGVVKELKVKVGDNVSKGSLVLMLEVAGAVAAPAPAAREAATPAAAPPISPAAAAPAAPAAASSAPAQAAGPIEIRVPDIGDFKDVSVIELMVKVGDAVRAEQSLITVESDKAAMEIPSSHAGTLLELKIKIGDTVNAGDVIAVLQGAAGAVTAVTDVAAATSAPVLPPGLSSTPAAGAPAIPVDAPPAAAPAHNPTAVPVGLPHA